MVVEATYVLCTASMRAIDEKEARHKEKVTMIRLFLIQNRLKHVCNAKTLLAAASQR